MASEPSLKPDPTIPYGPEGQQWMHSVSRYAMDPSGTDKSYLVKPPCKDPISVYPVLPDQKPVHKEFQSKFQVPSSGLSRAQIKEANEAALKRNRKFQSSFTGYQANMLFDYSHLKEFLCMHTNNVGDPNAESNCQMNIKGAYDDVKNAGEAIMNEVSKQPGGLYSTFEVKYDDGTKRTVQRLKVWVHVDGALGASFMNFLEMAHKHGKTDKVGPVFDFRLPFVCSITTSGHKWMGSPWPCGIFMTRSKLVLKPPSVPDYIGSSDTTFAGSRSGFSPLILWNYISTHTYDDQVEAVLRCFNYLQYISATQDGGQIWRPED